MKWLAALAVVALGSARESRFNRAIDLDKLDEDLNVGDEKDEAWGDLQKIKTKSFRGRRPFFSHKAPATPRPSVGRRTTRSARRRRRPARTGS